MKKLRRKYIKSNKSKYFQETFKKIKDKEIFKILMQQKIHLGHHRQNIKTELKAYVHSFFNDYGIINLKKTLIQLRIAMNIIFNLGLKHGNFLIVDSLLIDGEELDLSVSFEGILCIKRDDWVPGLLSNKKHVKYTMKQNLSKDNITSEEKDFYQTLLNYIDYIDMLVIIDPLSCKDIINEASRTNTPVISLVDLNGFLKNIDYPIICNNQNIISVFFILQLLIKAYKKGALFKMYMYKDKKKKKKKIVSTSFQKSVSKKDFRLIKKKKKR